MYLVFFLLFFYTIMYDGCPRSQIPHKNALLSSIYFHQIYFNFNFNLHVKPSYLHLYLIFIYVDLNEGVFQLQIPHKSDIFLSIIIHQMFKSS